MKNKTISEKEIELIFNKVDKSVEEARQKVKIQDYDAGFEEYVKFINSNNVKKIGDDENNV